MRTPSRLLASAVLLLSLAAPANAQASSTPPPYLATALSAVLRGG